MNRTDRFREISRALVALRRAAQTSADCEDYADAARIHIAARDAREAAERLLRLTHGAWIEVGGAAWESAYREEVAALEALFVDDEESAADADP